MIITGTDQISGKLAIELPNERSTIPIRLENGTSVTVDSKFRYDPQIVDAIELGLIEVTGSTGDDVCTILSNVRTITDNYTVTPSDSLILVNGEDIGDDTIIVTLPEASTMTGQTVRFVRLDTNWDSQLSITGLDEDLFGGDWGIWAYGTAEFGSSGNGWFVLSSYNWD